MFNEPNKEYMPKVAKHILFFSGGLHLKPPKFEQKFVAVITFPPFFCADTFDTNLLIIVSSLR